MTKKEWHKHMIEISEKRVAKLLKRFRIFSCQKKINIKAIHSVARSYEKEMDYLMYLRQKYQGEIND